MPKRVQKHYAENASIVRKKPILIDSSSRWSGNVEDNDESKSKVVVQKPAKQMQYLKFHQNNEVERLLLHNSKTLVYCVDHSDFPAFNVGMWPQESNSMLINYPSCAFSVPSPLYVSDYQCKKIDICYKRPMNRDLYKKRMRHTRSTYQTARRSNKNIRSSTKDRVYHSSVFDMAERMYMQPDPFFHSSYDFYFTGGNLCVIPQQDNIIHVEGEKLHEISASKLPVVHEYINVDSLHKVTSVQTSEDNEIFEVSPLITSLDSSRQNCFIARQRNLITFDYLNENNELKTVTQFRTKSTPFISFAQSHRDINNFIITTMKQHIRLYDLQRSVPALVKLFEISPKSPNISWNTVKPWRENTFMYANEKQFFLIDIRTSPEQWLNKSTFATDRLICDHISALLPSEFNNLFYVATNHKLQCMDIRHLKKSSLGDSEGIICSWSHQLRYAPLMMDTLRISHNEYVALSSPIAGDLHICQLSRERNEGNIRLESSLHMPKHIYSSTCLPYQPPTLLEAYENARLSGKCLKPEANLEARLKCCTTGMKFFKPAFNESNCGIGLLLTSNSNGDVFAHTLSKREQEESDERCNKQSDEIMSEFERKICERTQLPLNYTEIKNMKGLRKVFLCTSLSSVNKFDFDAMDNEYYDCVTTANNAISAPEKLRPKRLNLGRWQKSLSTLHSYKDALVADLLSIWDIDVEEERNIHLGNLRNDVKADPTLKVEDWLNKNNTNPPMISIPFQDLSTHCENDNTLPMFQSYTNSSQTQNLTIDFENAAHSTQILDNNINTKNLDLEAVIHVTNQATTTEERLKSKKKNKKYTKGF